MLIIEGSDCLGKSTVVKKIASLVTQWDGHPVATAHMSRPNGSFDFFTGYRPFISPYVIFDRFHLGSLAYHNDVMTKVHLRIIEGWIRSAGGLVVLLYSSDEKWYRDRIEHDPRGNILPVDLMCEANRRFTDIAHSENNMAIDYFIDVNESSGFVDDQFIERITKDWIECRREAIRTWTL